MSKYIIHDKWKSRLLTLFGNYPTKNQVVRLGMFMVTLQVDNENELGLISVVNRGAVVGSNNFLYSDLPFIRVSGNQYLFEAEEAKRTSPHLAVLDGFIYYENQN